MCCKHTLLVIYIVTNIIIIIQEKYTHWIFNAFFKIIPWLIESVLIEKDIYKKILHSCSAKNHFKLAQLKIVKPSSPPQLAPTTRGPGKWSCRFESAVVAPSGRCRLVVVVWWRGQSRYSCMMGYRYVIRSFSHLDGGCTTMYVDTVWGLLLKDIAHASVPLNASLCPLLPLPLPLLFTSIVLPFWPVTALAHSLTPGDNHWRDFFCCFVTLAT